MMAGSLSTAPHVNVTRTLLEPPGCAAGAAAPPGTGCDAGGGVVPSTRNRPQSSTDMETSNGLSK